MSDTPQRLAAALGDRYAFEREIGAGGMATVYLARDLRHSRPVAIKVVRPELGGPGLAPVAGPGELDVEHAALARLVVCRVVRPARVVRLQELTALATQPQYVYCHQWQPKDLVMW